MTSTVENIFSDLSSGDDSCTTPKSVDYLAVAPGRFLVFVDRDGYDEVLAEITAIGLRGYRYRRLPVIEIEATGPQVAQLAAMRTVNSVAPALRLNEASRKIANGIDHLLDIALGQNHAEVRRNDSSKPRNGRGYPILTDAGIAFDAEVDWPTGPTMMPVLNLSLGPRSPQYPVLSSDLAYVATVTAEAHGILVVAAAGNCGRLGPGSTSALARPSWVLAVGATADEAGTVLAPYSSIGSSEPQMPGPDLVAYGSSTLDPPRVGTSFAAPRVTGHALFVTAALLQLRRVVLLHQGAPVHGVPLVGAGIVDRFGTAIWDNPKGYDPVLLAVGALPILGVDVDAVRASIDLATTAGHTITMAGNSRLIRTLLLESARPVAGYGSEEVGAGFIDEELVLDRLSSLCGLDLVRLFGDVDVDVQIPDQMNRALENQKLFSRGGLTELRRVVSATSVLWKYDYLGQRAGSSPIEADSLRSLRANERILGFAAGPIAIRK